MEWGSIPVLLEPAQGLVPFSAKGTGYGMGQHTSTSEFNLFRCVRKIHHVMGRGLTYR